jgi:hypothetical protein
MSPEGPREFDEKIEDSSDTLLGIINAVRTIFFKALATWFGLAIPGNSHISR